MATDLMGQPKSEREKKLEKTKAVKSKKIDVLMAMQLHGLFDRTWDALCGDWLELFPKHTCNGSDVQECVADADRFRDYALSNPGLLTAWDSLEMSEQDELLNIFFPPRSRYG